MTEKEEALIRKGVYIACVTLYRIEEEEDLAQEVICKFLAHREPIHDLKAWSVICALNFLRSEYKMKGKLAKYCAQHPHRRAKAGAPAPTEELVCHEVSDKVNSIIKSLTPQQQESVWKWLQRRDGLKDGGRMPGKERAHVCRAFARIRNQFPEAASLLA